LQIEAETVAAGKNPVNERHRNLRPLWAKKTGLVSQGMAEEAGEFRMSTT